MLQACNELFRTVGRKQPDWLTAAKSSLQPLIMKRRTLFSHWLQSGSFADRQKYLSQRRSVAKVVSSSKNKWLQEKAQSIQNVLTQGRSREVWQDIRAICEYRAGIQPVCISAIKKKDGKMCIGPMKFQVYGENILRRS